ncbi:MAG: TraB/GumN family protein [bacterium]|nr:TraB/GumN family protein [bacterium]
MSSNTAKRGKTLRAVVLCCAVLAALGGCEIASEPVMGEREAQPIFWQIDGAEGGRLYLLGSIHVGPQTGWILPSEIIERFEASDALVVEVDMREGSPERQDDAVLRHGLLPPTQSVENHISAETYAMLERHATASGRSMANIHPWKPWMIATMILMEELHRLGYPTEAGVDLDLMARTAPEQRVVGLETAEEQLSLLGGMSPENQELMLKDILLQARNIETHFEELKEAWRNGDEERLEHVLFRELQRTPELAPFYEQVIYGRNASMCERLEKLMVAGETLFGVVGAYHLVGERGIPACLERRGFEVSRL